jgi:thymidine kinase
MNIENIPKEFLTSTVIHRYNIKYNELNGSVESFDAQVLSKCLVSNRKNTFKGSNSSLKGTLEEDYIKSLDIYYDCKKSSGMTINIKINDEVELDGDMYVVTDITTFHAFGEKHHIRISVG